VVHYKKMSGRISAGEKSNGGQATGRARNTEQGGREKEPYYLRHHPKPWQAAEKKDQKKELHRVVSARQLWPIPFKEGTKITPDVSVGRIIPIPDTGKGNRKSGNDAREGGYERARIGAELSQVIRKAEKQGLSKRSMFKAGGEKVGERLQDVVQAGIRTKSGG